MKEKIVDLLKRIEGDIDSTKLGNKDKEFLKEILMGVLTSQRGRLYSMQEPTYSEYITLREPFDEEDPLYKLCIVAKTTGVIDGRSYNFPSIQRLAEYANEHRDMLESELVNAENHQRRKNPDEEEKKVPTTPVEKYTQDMIDFVEAMPDTLDYKKQRAIDVLRAIEENPQHRFYTKKQDSSTEAIVLQPDQLGLSYYVTQRMFDYSGSTIGRNKTRLGIKNLVEYIDDNRITIDKEMKRIRKQRPTTEHPVTPKYPEERVIGE